MNLPEHDSLPVRRNKCLTVKPLVAVVLKRQPILPLLSEVLAGCGLDGISPVNIISSKSISSNTRALWLDAELFKDALHNIIEDASRNRDGDEAVRISLYLAGINTCRIAISYVRHNSTGERFYAASGYPYFLPARTRDILSQHRAKMTYERKGQIMNIYISIEK
jgi:hypothetical protein